jgi:acyl carrier protein|tara:strand:+ start:229 stop:459 length:231 start_codon:yes stop_codon:yes gene_type:complete
MSKSEIQKIKQAIAKILNEPEINILADSKSDDFAKWDSLAQIRIILEIEKISKKKIKTSKISELNSIKAISEYLTK